MPTKIPLSVPQLDLGTTEMRLGVWHVRDGRSVAEGDRLLEIFAGDVVVEISSPAEGTLHKLAAEEDKITVGQVVGEVIVDSKP